MELTQQDLKFILNQIRIAEANSNAHSGDQAKGLTEIWVDSQGNTTDANGVPYTSESEGAEVALGSSLLPHGLRTVDGRYNNFMEGREGYGASGESFVRLNDPHWATGTLPDGSTGDTEYETPSDVYDTAPRTISNLIVDQTPDNPAAIMTALHHAGYSGDFRVAVDDIQAAYNLYKSYVDMFDGPVLDIFKTQFDDKLSTYGIEMDGTTIMLPNVAPDDGISASYNTFFAAFGQFFDHGLDLVAKGGNGTVFIPLLPDDPLYVVGGHSNFMVVTRATVGEEARNITTPWVDQNQTYTSNPSHQVFLREYLLDDEGNPLSTGKLLEGDRGMATWADIKQQALEKLGIQLTDNDVTQVPVLLVDAYGEFIRGENGLPQILAAIAPDGSPIYVEGSLTNPVNPSAITLPPGTMIMGSDGEPVLADGPVSAARTGHAFLDDIAHVAAPRKDADGNLLPDNDAEVGYIGPVDGRGQNIHYDNELLDAHYITGDGRGNENISLTVVHHIFHGEHNLIADQVKEIALTSGDINLLNEWLLTDLTEPEFQQLLAQVQAPGADLTALASSLLWDGERVFQAARFTTEMEYQHLVFEEFARKIQPDIDAFTVFPDAELNPNIYSEFADVVYRFGHSMLNESFHQIDADGNRSELAIFDAFLNPLGFGSDTISHDVAAGTLLRGMTGQVANEIDEFVTNVLRNQLLGIPLDLAATNIARARDTGTPTLNMARAQFMEMADGDSQLKPYESWADYAVHLKNPASIINFIAAYGTHQTILDATTSNEKRDAAFDLVMGGGSVSDQDRLDFLNARGAYANDPDLGGLQAVDMWVGGLAEEKMSFGGMLGTTFSFIFEMQLEALQNADRFYYLSRVQGQNLLTQLEANSLAKMALRNTDLGETGFALPSDIFSTPGLSLYVDHAKQLRMTGLDDPLHDDPTLGSFISLVDRGDGTSNYLRYNGDEHIVIMGTDEDDHIIAGKGDDTIWGGEGNDRIEAGHGVDQVHGGEGDDIITNSGTDIGEVDMLHGDAGNDVIHGGSGMALIFGGSGKDYLVTGPDGSEIRSGTGDDFLLGGSGSDILFGNEGDDWIEGGGHSFDYIAGDNGELFFNSTIIGHDVLNGGGGDTDYDADSGDDIMFASEGIQKFIGMWGHDWVIHQGQSIGADADMNIEMFPTLPIEVLRDRYSQVEAVSGADQDDVIRGDDRTTEGEAAEEILDPTPEGNFKYNELDKAGIARISGLNDIVTDDLLQTRAYWADGSGEEKDVFVGGNILLGGGGSDIIEGRGGDDLIDGDAWLHVRVSILTNRDGTGPEIGSVDSLKDNVTLEINGQSITKSLSTWMVEGVINPGQLQIVREIQYDDSGIDTAVYWDNYQNYTISHKGEGRLVIEHTDFEDVVINPETGKKHESDGTDIVRNIEVLSFGDTDVNVIVGTNGNDVGAAARLDSDGGRDIIIGLEGNDLLRGLGGDDVLFGDAGDDDLRGGGGNDVLDGGAGNDLVRGQNGNDTLIWRVGGGHDVMDGGAGTDTVEIYGSDAQDAFGVYDRATAIDLGYTLRGTDTEIVIVHNGTVAAELINIEEIIVYGQGGDDSFVIGEDFNGTSLAMSTITLVGSDGNDTVDISSLLSPHRIVFQANGGNDTVIGEVRPQDDIQSEDEQTITFTTTNDQPGANPPANTLPTVPNQVSLPTMKSNGTLTLLSSMLLAGIVDVDGDTLTIEGLTASSGALEQISSTEWTFTPDPDDLGSVLFDFNVSDGNGSVAHSATTVVQAAAVENAPPSVATITPFIGTEAADNITGTDGDDAIVGHGGNDSILAGLGNDVVFAGDGDDTVISNGGDDVIFGGAGNDVVMAGDGDDTITGGAGDDIVFGGNGDDTFIAEAGDGNDMYFGQGGSDTLDMSAITADITVTLGDNGSGHAQSTQSGMDMLFDIENIRTGSGNDVIYANEATNRMDGGAGADTFVFASTLAADKDTIMSFESADIIDLSRIDANVTSNGNQAFHLIAGSAFSCTAGELLSRMGTDGEGRDITFVEGDVNGDGLADFQITLMGSHDLTESQFML